MKKIFRILLLTALILILTIPATVSFAGTVTVTENSGVVTIENSSASLSLTKSTGLYSATNKLDGKIYILNAYIQVENDKTVNGGYSVTHTVFDLNDSIGTGKKVRFTFTKAGKNDILAEFGMYDNECFITAAAGLRNLGSAFRLKTTYPLVANKADSNGGLFVGTDPADGKHRVLTGENDFTKSFLKSGINATSPASLAVVYLNRPEKKTMMLGLFTVYEYGTWLSMVYDSANYVTDNGRKSSNAYIKTYDEVGRTIDNNTTYIPDAAYIDFCTENPYVSLENYSRKVAKIMNVKLHSLSDYVSLCLWYAGDGGWGGPGNDSTTAVSRAQDIINVGLAKYAPPLIRLVPDTYVNPNEQMWWDNAHWRQFGHLSGSHYTLSDWNNSMSAIGAYCGLYMQPWKNSSDYGNQYPGHCLNNSSSQGGDYTDPAFQAHMRDVYTNMKNANIKYNFYDYSWGPTNGAGGGYQDPYATQVSANRKMLSLGKEVIGENFITCNNCWSNFGQYWTIGTCDITRTEMDKSDLTLATIRNATRRWFRNEITSLNDPDVQTLAMSGDQLHAHATFLGTLFGSVMLARKASTYTAEQVWALGRIFPNPIDGISARPVGFFNDYDQGDGPNHPIYDYDNGDGSHVFFFWDVDTNPAPGSIWAGTALSGISA